MADTRSHGSGLLRARRILTLAPGVDRRGVLAPGFDADLVAWAVDPAAERDDGEAFRQGHAILTVVGGETVMRV